MIYLVEFIIDDGCNVHEHVAIITAQNTGEAIFKFNQYIDPKLKYDELVTQSRFTAIKEEEDCILYCDYK